MMKRWIHASEEIESDSYYYSIAESFVGKLCSKYGFDRSKIVIDNSVERTPILEIINIYLSDLGLRLHNIRLEFSVSTKKISSGQGWKDGIWWICFPEDNVDVSRLVSELDRKSSFHKYLVPEKGKMWPNSRSWREAKPGTDKYEDMWNEWLSTPEAEINDELHIFAEPSVQGGYGQMVIFDNSNSQTRKLFSVDFSDWCDSEIMLASQSESEDDFKQKYKYYVLDLLKDIDQ